MDLAIQANGPAWLDQADDRKTRGANQRRLAVRKTDRFGLARVLVFPCRGFRFQLSGRQSLEIPAGSGVVIRTRERLGGIDGEFEVVRTEGGKFYLHECEFSSGCAPISLRLEIPADARQQVNRVD